MRLRDLKGRFLKQKKITPFQHYLRYYQTAPATNRWRKVEPATSAFAK